VNLEIIATEISEAGFRVHTAASGKEGLEKARALKPDVIILDIVMPEMDGWQVLRGLRQHPATSAIPVIVSSILDRSPEGVELGVAGWLAKPLDPTEFRRVMRSMPATGLADVLVVEDDEATRSLIEQELELLDCRVRIVASGSAALTALADRVPSVIILDLNLPDIDGLEVYRRVREVPGGAAIPFVIFTGKELSPADRERLHGGLFAIVKKGEGRTTLVEAVQRVLLRG
jgi:CheY-like chemotaxis protein